MPTPSIKPYKSIVKPLFTDEELYASVNNVNRCFNTSYISERRYDYRYPVTTMLQNLRRVDPEARVYGIELELPVDDLDRDNLEEFDALPVDRKADGSIGGGIEFVFPPMTRSQFKNNGIVDRFMEAYDKVRRPQSSSCGTHIHVPAAGVLSWSTMVAISMIINRAQNFSSWVAGRQGYDGYRSGLYAIAQVTSRRTVGLNGWGTVEFRIFKSVACKKRLEAWLEFVSCVVAYSRTKRVRDEVNRVLGVRNPDHANSVTPAAGYNEVVTHIRGVQLDNLSYADTDRASRRWAESFIGFENFAAFAQRYASRYPITAAATEHFSNFDARRQSQPVYDDDHNLSFAKFLETYHSINEASTNASNSTPSAAAAAAA